MDSLYAAGSERQAAQLAQSLNESSRFEVFVACLRPEGNLAGELRQIGFNDIQAFPLASFYDRSMVEQLARFPREEKVAAIYRRYEERLRSAGAVDFDDLLLRVVHLLESSPETLAWYRSNSCAKAFRSPAATRCMICASDSGSTIASTPLA